MYDIDFSDNLYLTQEKKDYFRREVDRLSKPNTMASRSEYELLSRQRAMISRNIIGELDEEAAFDLFFYGRFGLWINHSLRLPRNINPTFDIIKTLSRAQQSIRVIKDRYNLTTQESIEKINRNKETRKAFADDIINTNWGNYSKAFRVAIDTIIEDYSPRFAKGDYLYRISRVKKIAYSAPSDIPNPQLRKIIPNDIIIDRALWSSAVRAETTIFRYSWKGQDATHHKSGLKVDEEEVLFIIENNEHLKAIDISGYKFSKKREGRTSGELLIKSHTTFKVIGIQKSNPRLDRRIVILEPISNDSLKLGDVLKNPYDGNPYDPTTLPFPSLVAPTSSPETDPTAEATTSTLAAEAELGAVGGVSESFLPELK